MKLKQTAGSDACTHIFPFSQVWPQSEGLRTLVSPSSVELHNLLMQQLNMGYTLHEEMRVNMP